VDPPTRDIHLSSRPQVFVSCPTRFEQGSLDPPVEVEYIHRPDTTQSFENALEKARKGERLTVDDGVELVSPRGRKSPEIDQRRKEEVLRIADYRRAEMVGEEVTFVANLNNNVTTACNTGCQFCNFKDTASKFRKRDTPKITGLHEDAGRIPRDSARRHRRGIYEVCSVSGPSSGIRPRR